MDVALGMVAVAALVRSLLVRFATMALNDPDDDDGWLDKAAAAAAEVCGKMQW